MNLNRLLGRAKAAENAIRDRPFLPVDFHINGVAVKQFTLRHLLILFEIQSPVITGGGRAREDVGTFLWVVGPHYATADYSKPVGKWRRRWLKFRGLKQMTVREMFMEELVLHPNFHLFFSGIDRYLNRAMFDSPPIIAGGKSVAASFASGVIDNIVSVGYAWDDEVIFDK